MAFRPLRAPWVQSSLALLLAAWLRLCYATIRWTHVNAQAAEAVWASEGGVVLCFWHSRLAVAPHCWPQGKAQTIKVMISLSPDGEFIAKAMNAIGIPSIRGSSAKKSAADKAKGGRAAFMEALRWLRAGEALAISPDGPRGPAEVMAEGAAMLAKASGARVLMIGVSCSPNRRLNTWDRTMVPLPFGRGALVWDHVAVDEDASTADLCADWAARLTALNDRADAIAAQRP